MRLLIALNARRTRYIVNALATQPLWICVCCWSDARPLYDAGGDVFSIESDIGTLWSECPLNNATNQLKAKQSIRFL